MKFAIFGAAGFLGNTLANLLKSQGNQVWTIGRSDNTDYKVDITTYTDFEKLADINPDVVINCASALPLSANALSEASLRNFYNVNVIGGANIAHWAVAKSIAKLINCSTLAVVNKPWPAPLTESANTYPDNAHAAYATSKLSQEIVMNQIVAKSATTLVHLRLSALYGKGMKWEGIMAKLINEASAGQAINLTNGNNVSFDFLHIEDAAHIIQKISSAEVNSGIYNTASGNEVTLVQLADVIKEITGSDSVINNNDLKDSVSRAKIDISKLINTLGELNFTPLKKGIAELAASRKL